MSNQDERDWHTWRHQAKHNEPVRIEMSNAKIEMLKLNYKNDIRNLKKTIKDLESGITESEWKFFLEQRQAVRDFCGPYWDYIFWTLIVIVGLCIVVFLFAIF